MRTVTPLAGMTTARGMVLTAGLQCNDDRVALVFPMSSDGDPTAGMTPGMSLIGGFVSAMMADFLAILTARTYVHFLQAEGMVPGTHIPNRVDYEVTDHVGTGGTAGLPTRENTIGIYYGDPGDPYPVSGKIRVSKNFFPSPPLDDVDRDVVSAGMIDAIEDFMESLCNGFVGAGGESWGRVLASESNPANPLHAPVAVIARGYTGTVRRRTLPH